MHGFARQNRRAVELVGSLQPGGEIHRVAHRRVVEPSARADVAYERLAAIEADAHGKPAAGKGGLAGVHGGQPLAAGKRSRYRMSGMSRIGDGCPEHGHDGIADIFVHIAAGRFDDVGHGREIAVHQLYQGGGAQPLR